MKNKRVLVGAAVIAVAFGFAVSTVSAHGFGERYALPIPLNMFMIAAAATVAASFVVIGLFVNKQSSEFSYPRYNLLTKPVVGPILRNRVFVMVIKLVSVAVFLLVIATSLFGINKPVENFSPTFVWIVWWVGMGYISALLGNFWMMVNPWKTVFEWIEGFIAGKSSGNVGLFEYPDNWGIWPAVGLFFVFAWLENVYNGAAVPFKLGLILLAYSIVTWGGMIAFGKYTWLRHGELFSVLFAFFARFSPTEVRVSDDRLCTRCDGCANKTSVCIDCYQCFETAKPDQREFNVRPFAVGLANPGSITSSSAIFVVLTLAFVTFDGISETNAWLEIQDSLQSVVSGLPGDTFGIIDTMGILIVPAVFLAVYMAFAWGIRQFEGTTDSPVFDIAKVFVVSLIPIALAYNMAHFVSLLAIQGQGIIPLVSDPFGNGWDIFGTAGYRVNNNIITTGFVWWVSIVAIVLGHIISVYIAHVISLRRMPTASQAVKSQYPMLALMVFYTATSLWIIAQPIAK